MAVRIEGGVVHLVSDCGVEDAETVAAALAAAPFARVDLDQCRQLHGAVVQALLVFRPQIVGLPADDFLKAFVVSRLTERTEHGTQVLPNVQGHQ